MVNTEIWLLCRYTIIIISNLFLHAIGSQIMFPPPPPPPPVFLLISLLTIKKENNISMTSKRIGLKNFLDVHSRSDDIIIPWYSSHSCIKVQRAMCMCRAFAFWNITFSINVLFGFDYFNRSNTTCIVFFIFIREEKRKESKITAFTNIRGYFLRITNLNNTAVSKYDMFVPAL